MSIYLSDLLRYRLLDGQNRSARLVELSCAMEHDYPPVTSLWYAENSGYRRLSWSQVTALEVKSRTLRVDCLQGQSAELAAGPSEVLLVADVFDGLVLDLQNRRATRANDLLLTKDGPDLRLRGADISLRAILRRLTRGWLGRRPGELYDWKYVEFLRGKPGGTGTRFRRFQRLPAGDLAAMGRYIPYLHAAEMLCLLPDALAAEVLQALGRVRQRQVVDELADDQVARLLAYMAPDLAADMLADLGAQRAQQLLNLLEPRSRERILELLHYEATCVGGVMTNDVLVLPDNCAVREVYERVRRQPARFVYTLFVCEAESQRLSGTVDLHRLMAAAPDCPLSELANPYVVSLTSSEPALEAAYRVMSSGLPAWPVLNEEGRVLGAVTSDIALEQVVSRSLREQMPKVLS